MTMILVAILALILGFVLGAFFIKMQSSKNETTVVRLEEQLTSQKNLTERLENEKSNLTLELKNLHTTKSGLQSELASLKTKLEEEQKAFTEKWQAFKETEKNLTAAFQDLSVKALEKNNQSFLTLAKENLGKFQNEAKSDLDFKQKAIQTLVNPLQESLKKFDDKINSIEKERVNAYAGLMQQVQSLNETQKTLKNETGNLVNALKAPQVRGRWGEMTLKRVAELAGMIEYCDFIEQESQNTESGLIRPDMVVKLPHGKEIVVDSKTPLLAYTQSLEARNVEEQKAHLKNHAKQLQTHMKQLGQKQYWNQFRATPEFVVMFVPGESFFSAALKENPNLIEEGVRLGVILATPTTLISLLKAVSYGWRQEQLAQNAHEISKLGKDLYERLGTLATHFEQLGQSLHRSTQAYNKAVGTLETRVLPQARKFANLGIKPKEAIKRLQANDSPVRDLQSPELLAEDSQKELNS